MEWGNCSATSMGRQRRGLFLRSFKFGHVRQLDSIASRLLINLVALTPLIAHDPADTQVFLDV